MRQPFLSFDSERISAWVPEFLKLGSPRMRDQMRLLGAAVLVGIVAGIGAIVFYAATRAVAHHALGVAAGYRPHPPAGEADVPWLAPSSVAAFRPWMLLLVPAVGGLLSGLLVFTLAPEAEGHGTDAVIAAYHGQEGRIRTRVPLVKIVASALTIGTGGSGGREGPIAQIGAGFGSLLATILGLRPSDRRVLCAAGMGAGIAAIFRAPLAGALFASEVLYWSPEFEPEVIIPAGIACVVSYCTFGAAFGWKPLFATPDLTFSNPWELGPYTLLAIAMVILAFVYTRTFEGVTGRFQRLRIPQVLKPATGAFATGVVGFVLYFAFGRSQHVLSVLSFGYSALQDGMTDDTSSGATLLLAIALGKIVTTGLTIGSGGSGGVFGPSMVIGGCGGGALGVVLHRVLPQLVPHPASFIILGMAAFFAAAAKTPFSTLVIVSEMTGGYHLLLPALWVCVLAFMLSDRRSLYASQVETRSSSPAHRKALLRVALGGATIERYIRRDAPVLAPSESISTIVDRITESRLAVLPVAREGRLVGLVSFEDVVQATQSAKNLIVAADLSRSVEPLLSTTPIEEASARFGEEDLVALAVVTDLETRRVLGMVTRFDIASTYVRLAQGGGRAAE